jgi:CheY-like chemotaxis protein/anti-sigma regulatory factor (Ser/Thr protein kinase)
MTRVLVVEDSLTQAAEIALLLQDAGFETELAGHGEEALAALKKGAFDVVLTDMVMPVMNGLELVEAVRREHPGVPVVLMTARGSEEIAVEALRKGAASYVPKRILATSIVATLDDVLAVARAEWDQRKVLGCLTEVELTFTLDNDVAVVAPLTAYLEPHLARLHGSDRTERLRVGMALREALLNAIEHGNLEVSSELRQHDEREYRALIEQRRRQSPYQERRVCLWAHIDRELLVFVVTDEGPGFNPSALPDPNDPANMEQIGGRGLLLIRTFMDHVEHNAAGNQITLVKRPGAGFEPEPFGDGGTG